MTDEGILNDDVAVFHVGSGNARRLNPDHGIPSHHDVTVGDNAARYPGEIAIGDDGIVADDLVRVDFRPTRDDRGTAVGHDVGTQTRVVVEILNLQPAVEIREARVRRGRRQVVGKRMQIAVLVQPVDVVEGNIPDTSVDPKGEAALKGVEPSGCVEIDVRTNTSGGELVAGGVHDHIVQQHNP